MKVLFLVAVVLMTLTGQSSAQAGHYRGWVFMDEKKPGVQSEVIRSQEQLDKFLDRIPERVPSKKHPAPKNSDPLLAGEKIDFSQSYLVLCLRPQMIDFHPVYLARDSQEDKVVVWFELPPEEASARPYGWGVYGGVLIPKTDKPIIVKYD